MNSYLCRKKNLSSSIQYGLEWPEIVELLTLQVSLNQLLNCAHTIDPKSSQSPFPVPPIPAQDYVTSDSSKHFGLTISSTTNNHSWICV